MVSPRRCLNRLCARATPAACCGDGTIMASALVLLGQLLGGPRRRASPNTSTGPAPGRGRAARRAPPRPRSLGPSRAASSGSRPRARCAASADECVQPEPCAGAVRDGARPGSRRAARRRRRRPIASPGGRPVTTTARGPSAWIARASLGLGLAGASALVPRAGQHACLGEVRRHDRHAREQARAQRLLGVLVEQPRAALGDHHRVEHDRQRRRPGRAPRPPRRSSRACRACRS